MKPLALALLLSLPALAAEPAKPPPVAKDELTQWLLERTEQYQIPYAVANMVTLDRSEKPLAFRLHPIAQWIASNDRLLNAYTLKLESNQKTYGRVSPFDRVVLEQIRAHELDQKRSKIERAERLAEALGIAKPAPAEGTQWQDALSAKASGPQRRYNVDSGLWDDLPKKP